MQRKIFPDGEVSKAWPLPSVAVITPVEDLAPENDVPKPAEAPCTNVPLYVTPSILIWRVFDI